MSIKKIKLDRCPHMHGHIIGIVRDKNKPLEYKGYRKNMRCNSWSCPYCREKKLKQLKYRIYNGSIMNNPHNTKKFCQKFLTLTYGGKKEREKAIEASGGNKVLAQLFAYEQMSKSYDKLFRALKKRYGHFEQFKVSEIHRDGWPHFHVLIAGRAVRPKSILNVIEDLWRVKYGHGFVKLVAIRNGMRAAVKYLLKYLTKDLRSVGRYKRVFSASKGALEKVAYRGQSLWSRIFWGKVDENLGAETKIIERKITVEDAMVNRGPLLLYELLKSYLFNEAIESI